MSQRIVDTFSDFVSAISEYDNKRKPAHWRTGQAAFNLLNVVRPDLADMVRGNDFDPFHNDNNLPLFYDFVMRHWDDDKEIA
jgi:hypothetical protein